MAERLREIADLTALPGTKDPAASDVMYTRALAAQFTVMTMSEATLKALSEHGEITTLLRADGGNCEQTLAAFTAAGIDLYTLAAELQDEGAEAFTRSWNELMGVIAAKVATVMQSS